MKIQPNTVLCLASGPYFFCRWPLGSRVWGRVSIVFDKLDWQQVGKCSGYSVAVIDESEGIQFRDKPSKNYLHLFQDLRLNDQGAKFLIDPRGFLMMRYPGDTTLEELFVIYHAC